MKKSFFTILLLIIFSFSINANIKLLYNQFSESIILTSSWEKSKILKNTSDIDAKSIKISYMAYWNGKNSGSLKVFFLIDPNLSLETDWYLSIPIKNGEKKLSPEENNLTKYIKKGEQAWSTSFCLEELLELQKISKEPKKEIIFYFFNTKGEKIYFVWNKYSNLNRFLEILLALLP